MRFTEPIPSTTSARPQWLRVPQAVELFGIGKSSLYDLIARGKIRSALVSSKRTASKTGTKHGSRLVCAASLDAYISSFATGGDEKAERCAKKGGARP